MDNLKVIENGLVPVYETDKGIKVVNGRELHQALQSKQDFSTWVKKRLAECDAEENTDYDRLHKKMEANNATMIEYIIQLDTAKEMAMLERNEKGKQVRRYFIQLEKKYKEVQRVIALQNEKYMVFMEQQSEFNKQQSEFNKMVLEKMQERTGEAIPADGVTGGVSLFTNPFNPGEIDLRGRMRHLNDLIDQTSELCGLERNQTLHYMYQTLQDIFNVSLKAYLEVMKCETDDNDICNLHVIARVDRFYEKAVEMNENVIGRKRVYG